MKCDRFLFRLAACACFAAAAFAGCGKEMPRGVPASALGSPGTASKPAESTAKKETAANDKKEHEHGEWWCDEHGVPEEVCALCDSKLVAEFKKKNDWCSKHERPKSQCFKCDPKLAEGFAAKYEAKYGKKPPKPSDD